MVKTMLETILVAVITSSFICALHLYFVNKQCNKLLEDLGKLEVDFMEQIKSIVRSEDI